jgi:hypothetical protein
MPWFGSREFFTGPETVFRFAQTSAVFNLIYVNLSVDNRVHRRRIHAHVCGPCSNSGTNKHGTKRVYLQGPSCISPGLRDISAYVKHNFNYQSKEICLTNAAKHMRNTNNICCYKRARMHLRTTAVKGFSLRARVGARVHKHNIVRSDLNIKSP